MESVYRLFLLFIFTLLVTGCSSIHNSLSPNKQSSELRALVQAPTELEEGESPFCAIAEIQPEPAPTKEIVRIPAPYTSKLYFLLDQVIFTSESELEAEEIYQTLLDRNDNEIIISGHTDTSATNSYNDALSQRRAEKVQQDLINFGISADAISISFEGEYRLLVNTPDETVEVMNRRVEINVR
ncbi:MAG: OmpA family protein [Piscirickettsiaceae bacterium]|nr:OmpA family protein [Piscirickettsiaceae bacterium]